MRILDFCVLLHFFTKNHIAQLSPLVTDEYLDSIDELLQKAKAKSSTPYTSRIDDQIILWQSARFEVQSIYKTMLAQYKYEMLDDNSLPADRLYVLALASQALEYTEKASGMLISSSERLRGPHFYKDSGALVGWAQGNLRHIVEQLKPKSADANQVNVESEQ